MRLTVDDQIFTRQVRGGISRYFVELIRQFIAEPDLEVSVDQPQLWSLNQHLLEAGMGRRMPTRLGSSRRALMVANDLRFRARHPDVLHHTFYSRRYLRATRVPRVRAVTIYDMIPEVYPDLFPTGNAHFDKREFVEAADVIFCISESTRRDLVHFYGEPSVPVIVTHLAVNSNFSPTARKRASLPERYIMQVGARSDYKDFGVLAEAFAQLPAGSPPVQLLVVGPKLTATEVEMLNDLRISDRVVRVDLVDADMPGAYANAVCFVYPSRYEGFGLPTLEAMSSGCPVILANASSHPEIGGAAAQYFPPGDSAALYESLQELCSQEDLRQAHISQGLDWAREFSWERTAALTAEGYRAAADQKG